MKGEEERIRFTRSQVDNATLLSLCSSEVVEEFSPTFMRNTKSEYENEGRRDSTWIRHRNSFASSTLLESIDLMGNTGRGSDIRRKGVYSKVEGQKGSEKRTVEGGKQNLSNKVSGLFHPSKSFHAAPITPSRSDTQQIPALLTRSIQTSGVLVVSSKTQQRRPVYSQKVLLAPQRRPQSFDLDILKGELRTRMQRLGLRSSRLGSEEQGRGIEACSRPLHAGVWRTGVSRIDEDERDVCRVLGWASWGRVQCRY